MKIELKNISLKFEEKSPLFTNINLTIEHGDFILIRGKSGIGKSSFLRLLNRLHEPTEGQIWIEGKPITDHQITSLRRRIGYLQQTPTMIAGSIEDNLNLPFHFKSGRQLNRPSQKILEQMLENFLLTSIDLQSNAQNLSVGEKQRIALIRTFLSEPEIILCDEPTSALDSESQKIVENAIEQINVEKKTTVLLVTHLDFIPKRAIVKKFTLNQDSIIGEEK
ncbi:MAG: ATP-binding cassette domain-containing protein [Candidatus Poribacteria bacterium]|nr:ATP-binding cassette domain-containing protein [Candidatus Poribacteria bacterium]